MTAAGSPDAFLEKVERMFHSLRNQWENGFFGNETSALLFIANKRGGGFFP
jgi:hypothetical protein